MNSESRFLDLKGLKEEELLSDSPRINSGSFQEVCRTTFPEVEEMFKAFDIASTCNNRKEYDVWKVDEIYYVQTPTSGPQSVKGYINQLERAAIVMFRDKKAAEERYENVSILQYLKYRFKKYIRNLKSKGL